MIEAYFCDVDLVLGMRNISVDIAQNQRVQCPLLLTWFNFNPSMDK